MKPALVDVAVLILFFNRPEPLKAVFSQVKKARPSKLFLYQDGPRNEKDMPGILACREVDICPKNGPFLMLINVSFWKMMIFPLCHFSRFVKRCWTSMNTIRVSV